LTNIPALRKDIGALAVVRFYYDGMGEPVTHPAVLMRRRQLNTAVESPTPILRFESHVFPSGSVNVVDNYLSGLFSKTEAEEKANTW
jgi:hypothetical protein